jgi:Kinesin motor domain
LNLVTVDNLSQVRELLDHAQFRRTTGCTRLNERSSRSHAIYTLSVTIDDSVTAKLTLVDLAGSERIKESGVVGSQRKESIHINKDLFVLGKVVASLHERSGHVPYRDSKLTRLLRDSLGGTFPKRVPTIQSECTSVSLLQKPDFLILSQTLLCYYRKLSHCFDRLCFAR